MANVIVFGPTGNVGSFTARAAQEHGAKAFLAMRDPSKSIPGLDSETERIGEFERVQADLSEPATVAAAIKTTKAKRAFIYMVLHQSDHMRASIEALKAAGTEFVVFLSSSTIQGKISDISPAERIPWIHAQVELNLEAVFGPENYVAIRPGRFATNNLRYGSGILAGDVKIFAPHFLSDAVTPDDIGRVSGTILAKGRQDGQRQVYLYGPQVMNQEDIVNLMARVFARKVKITTMSNEDAFAECMAAGVPKEAAQYRIKKGSEREDPEFEMAVHYEEGLRNIEKYTGRKPLGLEQWLSENKDLFGM